MYPAMRPRGQEAAGIIRNRGLLYYASDLLALSENGEFLIACLATQVYE